MPIFLPGPYTGLYFLSDLCCLLPTFYSFLGCILLRKGGFCLQLIFEVKGHDLQLYLFRACWFVPSLDAGTMVPAG